MIHDKRLMRTAGGDFLATLAVLFISIYQDLRDDAPEWTVMRVVGASTHQDHKEQCARQ
jgi:hypothetical protein